MYKNCNIFIHHEGLDLHVSGIKKWETETLYHDLRNENGYIGFIKGMKLKYTNKIIVDGQVIRFYKTIQEEQND